MKVQIVVDGKTYEVEYDTAGNSLPLPTGDALHIQSIVLPTPGLAFSGTTDVDESKVCRSPLAGIVARINVGPGQSAKAGDIMLVVEAMKMENNLSAPSVAKIKSVKVKVGDSVKVGQVLVEFE